MTYLDYTVMQSVRVCVMETPSFILFLRYLVKLPF